ncbi:hypothetical protein AB0O40_37385, partial [Streptomyces sp. NPDC089919]
ITVPRYGPEKICWALSDAYHEVEGGHIRMARTPRLKRRRGWICHSAGGAEGLPGRRGAKGWAGPPAGGARRAGGVRASGVRRAPGG